MARSPSVALIAELKRRNVFRAAIAYLALAWLLIEVAGTLFPGFGIPDWAFRFVVIVLALGFVPLLIFSWAYEITPDGLKREKEVVRDESVTHLTAKRLDTLTIGLIVVALAFIVVDRLWLGQRLFPQPAPVAEPVQTVIGAAKTEPVYVPNSIAVLPFANRSDNPKDVFFVDGIHDDLLTYISQIGSIKTISRTSVMKYRDSTQSIPEIAKELGVATVLEGGVQRAGEQVRINVQLIDARSDDHLWSNIYDRQLTATNIFTIQSEIAESIADALRATLTPEARERIHSIPTENLEALESYFLGRQSMAMRTASELNSATTYFEAAITQDPTFSLAYVGLAETYLLRTSYGDLSSKEGFAKSQVAAEQALRLNPQLGEAYASIGKRKDWEGDHVGAEAAFKRALQMNPNYAPSYQWYGQMLSRFSSRIPEALDLSRRAVELDPRSAIIVTDYGEVLWLAGRIEEALTYYRAAVEIEPQFIKAYRQIARLYRSIGSWDEAIASFHIALEHESDDRFVYYGLGVTLLLKGDARAAMEAIQREKSSVARLAGLTMVQFALGEREDSDALLGQLIANYEREASYTIAYVLAYRDEADRAFEWLDKAVKYSDGALVSIELEPLFRNIHEDPRWLPFIEKIGKWPGNPTYLESR
jgi:TolB-like protein/Tfp pilus assembly protein PilF